MKINCDDTSNGGSTCNVKCLDKKFKPTQEVVKCIPRKRKGKFAPKKANIRCTIPAEQNGLTPIPTQFDLEMTLIWPQNFRNEKAGFISGGNLWLPSSSRWQTSWILLWRLHLSFLLFKWVYEGEFSILTTSSTLRLFGRPLSDSVRLLSLGPSTFIRYRSLAIVLPFRYCI